MVGSALRRMVAKWLGRAGGGALAPARRGLLPGVPDWAALLGREPTRWRRALAEAAGGPAVLLATNVGGHGPVGVLESTLAVALTLRGARVHVMLCDGLLPGCLKAAYGDLPDPSVLADYRLAQTLCPTCVERGRQVFEPLGVAVHRLGDLVDATQRATARDIAVRTPAESIPSLVWEGLAVGEHANAGALRYYARGDLRDEPQGEIVLRRYLEASVLSAFATRTLIDRSGCETSCFHHGLYVPQGIVGEVCRSQGVGVANWVVAYRRGTFIFSHGDTYHHTLLDEPTSEWRDMSWGPEQDRAVLEYLRSRWHGTKDWISFHEKPDLDFAEFAKSSGIDLTRPIVGMLTNVMWDAQLHYRANAFPSMLEWVLATIEYFRGRPELQLLIRVHPAEIRGTLRSRQPLMSELVRRYPTLPGNVHVIPPESPVSTYAAMMQCDSVIIYGTKTGVELTAVGVPVIVGGEAWIRNKGLTLDASSPAEYFGVLDRLPFGRRNPDEQTESARKYAYHFFFRRMIPLPFMRQGGPALYEVAIDGLDDLMPGRYPGLDVICDGVLKGTPFVYPAETLSVAVD